MRRTKGNCGMYEIKNTETNKRYIGVSINIPRRRKQHFSALNQGTHQNSKLQSEWDKYGRERFTFEVKELCKRSELLRLEQETINSCKEEGVDIYNEDTFPPSRVGTKLSEEHKRKIGEANKGHAVSLEARKKISDANKERVYTEKQLQRYAEINRRLAEKRKGKFHHSEESKQKMSDAIKGRKHSEESKQKMSAIRKGKSLGEENPFYGKEHSDEVKKQMSKGTKEWWQTPENHSKMKQAAKVRWQDLEERKKQSERRKAYWQLKKKRGG